jgi:hypothetical protein
LDIENRPELWIKLHGAPLPCGNEELLAGKYRRVAGWCAGALAELWGLLIS